MGDTTQAKFVICDQSIDSNHGYRKMQVENSEVAKKRAALEKRLSTLERWTVKAKERSDRASRLYDRLWKQTKAYGDEQYRLLTDHQTALREQGMDMDLRHTIIKQEQKRITRTWRSGGSGCGALTIRAARRARRRGAMPTNSVTSCAFWRI